MRTEQTWYAPDSYRRGAGRQSIQARLREAIPNAYEDEDRPGEYIAQPIGLGICSGPYPNQEDAMRASEGILRQEGYTTDRAAALAAAEEMARLRREAGLSPGDAYQRVKKLANWMV